MSFKVAAVCNSSQSSIIHITLLESIDLSFRYLLMQHVVIINLLMRYFTFCHYTVVTIESALKMCLNDQILFKATASFIRASTNFLLLTKPIKKLKV